MNKMNSFFIKSINQLKESNLPIIEKKYESIGKCPACKGEVLDKKKVYGCENKDCNFVIFKDNSYFKRYKKKLTKTMAKKLLKDGKVLVKGLISPKNENYPFDAFILLKKSDENQYKFSMDFNTESK